MPDSKANQARAKQNELLKRYQKEEKSRTDQDSWEASKVAAAQSQFSRGVWQQGKEYDLVIEVAFFNHFTKSSKIVTISYEVRLVQYISKSTLR